MTTSRVPAGVPTGGQFAASAHAESGVALLDDEPISVADVAADPTYVETMQRFRDADNCEPDAALCDEVAAQGRRLLDAAEEDRPGRDALWMAVTSYEDPGTGNQDYWADRIVDTSDYLTSKRAMKVVEHVDGGHLRLHDGQRGATCSDCGSGFATSAVLLVHQARDCEGAGDDDDDRYDAIHSAAESFASDINNAGRAEQVAFLRRMGVKDEQILAVVTDSDQDDDCLDDLVIDACSDDASSTYNGTGTPESVTASLEGKRWMLCSDRVLTDKHPTALEPGECTDLTFQIDGRDITYRISYNHWIPEGDNGSLAHDYLRGEFSAESEWARHDHPVARESAPFRPARGEKSHVVGYAWDKFHTDLYNAAVRSERAVRSDPLRGFIEGDGR